MHKALNFIAGIAFTIGIMGLTVAIKGMPNFDSDNKGNSAVEGGEKDCSGEMLRLSQATTTIEYYEDKDGVKYPFRDMIIMAEAGYRPLKKKPAIDGIFKVGNLQLPPGYSIYQGPAGSIILDTYVYFKGKRPVGDYMEEKEQWFGPF